MRGREEILNKAVKERGGVHVTHKQMSGDKQGNMYENAIMILLH